MHSFWGSRPDFWKLQKLPCPPYRMRVDLQGLYLACTITGTEASGPRQVRYQKPQIDLALIQEAMDKRTLGLSMGLLAPSEAKARLARVQVSCSLLTTISASAYLLVRGPSVLLPNAQSPN